MTWDSKAYDAGVSAKLAGDSVLANPYRRDREWNAWEAGYSDTCTGASPKPRKIPCNLTRVLI